MSYQVLARKWRPRNFSSLVGQEHVVRALTHALTEQRLHHAYLFTGTRGVGKTTIARILAKSLNCELGVTAAPCGQCSACLEIDSGRFVDLLEVDAATNTRVDEMRQLLENAVYAPTRGRFKVYVIDEVHMLSNSAFNAMLKTLEEPPEHVKFILATTDPQKIPVTVLSRCLQFNLKQMPVGAIVSHLEHILQAENIQFERPALGLVARSAAGSMRDALSLLDQAIAHGSGRVEEIQVRNMLGSVDAEYLYSLLEGLQDADINALTSLASDLALRSLSFSAALQELAGILTQIQLLQFAPTSIDEEGEHVRLKALAKAFSVEFVQLAYQIVIVGRSELSLAPDEHAGFLMTLMRLYAFRPLKVADVISRQANGGSQQRALSVHAVSPASSRQASRHSVATLPDEAGNVTVVDGGAQSNDWSAIVGALSISGMVKELALNCELRSQEEGRCVLRLPPEKSHLQMKPAPDRLQQALSEYFRRPVILKIEVALTDSETPAASAGRQRQELEGLAQQAIHEDGFVRDVIQSLDGSIVESSIKPVQ